MNTHGKDLKIHVAGSAGTCFGVEAAIQIAERVRKPILGPLVHNPKIVGDLADQGIEIMDRYPSLEEIGVHPEIIITAHGYPKPVKDALREKGINIHDATCPVLLKWVYRKIEKFTDEGYYIILIGNPNHAEIIASRSYGSRISVVYSCEEADKLPDNLGKVLAICQTTIMREKFDQIVDHIRATKYPDLRAIDTRCKPVKNQQSGVEELAQIVDCMLIVGGFNSSNTTSLANIAKKYLPNRTYHIDRPELIEDVWLKDVKLLGIGAGTSTPKEQIIQVIDRVKELFPGNVNIPQEWKILPKEKVNAETLSREDVSEEI
jgi:4-hydroxy-3-methylbut-2-enyl diphosphate reductase